MGWRGINLEEKLKQRQQRSELKGEDEILRQFKALLQRDAVVEERILKQIFEAGDGAPQLDWRLCSAGRIFNLSQIKNLCTDYRLRFLEARLFKGDIPQEAVSEVKRLQKDHQVNLSHFMILAPAPMFVLEERDRDPLLFAPLGNGRYYLIHRWGRDLHPLRKLLVWPFRSFKSLLSTVALLALAVVLSVPDSMMLGPYDNSTAGIRVIFFFYLFIAFSGLSALYGFSRMKNFNANLWNSRYFD